MNLSRMSGRAHPQRGRGTCVMCGKDFPKTRNNRRTCSRKCYQQLHLTQIREHRLRAPNREHPWCAAFDFLYPLAKAGLNWETLPVPYSQFGPKFVQSVRLGVQLRLQKCS